MIGASLADGEENDKGNWTQKVKRINAMQVRKIMVKKVKKKSQKRKGFK